jgi:hypothetical protein
MAIGYGTWTFTTVGDTLIELALMEVPVADTEFLTRDGGSLDNDDLAAHYLTEAEREARDEHRGFGLQSSTLTVAANSRDMTISSLSMDGAQIALLKFSDSSHPANGRPIPIHLRQEGDQIWGQYSDSFTSEVPAFAYWSEDAQTLKLSTKVPSATDFEVWFWTEPATFTKANKATETSTIPDTHKDVVYLRLAMKFADLLRKDRRVEQLSGKLAAADERLTRAIAKGADVLEHNEHYQYGSPQQIAQDRFARIGRY